MRRYVLAGLLTLVAVFSLPAAADNPPAAGFDVEGSDREAIELADRVMEQLGGRAAWDQTRFITWRFFGARRHFWDKHSGDIRVEGKDRESGTPYLILMNLHSVEGRAWSDGVEVEGERLAEMLERGESAWINDSYWMFMPYKLKDSGVTLSYVGPGSMQDGREAEVLELTFREVGRTPENRYLVYVAADSGLVEQWDYYAKASDEEPGFQVPWHEWQPFGAILLSADRGKNGHTDIAVFETLPGEIFSRPEAVDLTALGLGGE